MTRAVVERSAMILGAFLFGGLPWAAVVLELLKAPLRDAVTVWAAVGATCAVLMWRATR